MDYFKIYDRLIDRARTRVLEGYTERHHVMPRCMGGDDHPRNIVALTAEEHYVAHQLLAKMYPSHPGLYAAAALMCSRPSNKMYGWLKRRLSSRMAENNPNAGGHSRRKYIAENGPIEIKKYVWTDEGRETISKQMKENNPMRKVRPWTHPAATASSLEVWSQALEYYAWWRTHQRSYHSMAKQFGFEKPSMAHHNMVKMFRKGWKPDEDQSWLGRYAQPFLTDTQE